jgi:hypothetical protein
MNQKLSDWASIAEIMSGIAVVVTLLLLFMGVRENTNTTRAAEYGNLIDGILELESNRLNDPELMRLWIEFQSGEAFNRNDPNDQRLGLYLQMLVRNYEKAFYQYRYGVIGEAEWQRFRDPICAVRDRSEGAGLDGIFDSGPFSADFRAFVTVACGD